MSCTVSFSVLILHSECMGMGCHMCTCNSHSHSTPSQTVHTSYGLVQLACSFMRENTFICICLNRGSEVCQLSTQFQHFWCAGWNLHGRLAEVMVRNPVQAQLSEWLFTMLSIPAFGGKMLLLQNPTRQPPRISQRNQEN